MCLSSAAIIRAGVNANADIKLSGTFLAQWSDDAEGAIEAETRDGLIAGWGSLTAAQKQLASRVCASMIATDIINYDMGGYNTNGEAVTMLNVLDDIISKGIVRLKKLL